MFLTTLKLEVFDEHKNIWRLTAPLVYRSDYLDETITVPTGYVTDLASVPDLPMMTWLFGREGESASVVHDYLISERVCDRADADEVFLEAMKETGVPSWKRNIMHWAVSLYRTIRGKS